MLGGKRTERVAELIKAELGTLILMKLKDPRLGFVTITRVQVSPDLRHARVWYSVLKSQPKPDHTTEALESARCFLQRELAAALTLRLTPVLSFELDHSVDHSMQIEAIIRQIHSNDDKKKEE